MNKTRKHISIADVDSLKGKKIKVLDKGFLMLKDYMGGDKDIVEAARNTIKETKNMRSDRGLIRYLFRHYHNTPFEMVELKFVAKMPIFVARQWVRHRTASINEYSGRYSKIFSDYYVPDLENIQGQSKSNRQGRENGILSRDVQLDFQQKVIEISENAYKWYEKYLDADVAKELARIILPINFYTQWYWKANLHNIFHFLDLRMDIHAELETREYANTMAGIVKILAPIAYEAFEDFTLNSISLSLKERIALGDIINGKELYKACEDVGLLLRKDDGSRIKGGEGPEFLDKLKGIVRR